MKWKKWKQIVAILVIIFTISGLSVFADNNDTTPEVAGESQTGKDNTITSPEVTEPEVTKPEVTEPEVTEPEVTKPEVTEPEVTEPEVTKPEVTEPVKKTPETKDKKQAAKPRAVETIEDIFPDGGLALAVRAALNKNNVTDVVTQAELDSIQTLDAENRGIVDLTGIGRLSNLKVLRVANNRIVDFSMVDWGKIVSVFAEGQLINLTLDIDWSEKVTIDSVFKEPTISDPSYATNIQNRIEFTDFPPGDSFYDGLDMVELPGKLVIEGLENVNQTLNMKSFFGRDNNSNPVTSPRFLYSAEFKVKLNQVSKKATFDNEGLESSNQIPVTDLIKEPTTPTKQGYAFMGWYDARSGGTKWDFVTDKMPNKDMTLYAQYSKKSYEVIFDNAGNKKVESVPFETLVKEPAAPTKQGYAFLGWYDAETGGTKWDFTKDKMPASDLTLYARYEKNPDKSTPVVTPPKSDTPTPRNPVITNSNSQETTIVNEGSTWKGGLPKTGDVLSIGLPILGAGLLVLVGVWTLKKRKKSKM